MGFDAGASVAALTYDFTTSGGYTGPEPPDRDAADGHSTIIPEPTDQQLEQLAKATADIAKTAADVDDGATADELVRSLAQMDPAKLRESNEQMVAAIAAFCQNRPSTNELQGLPWRSRQAFFGWLLGEVFSPKA